MAGSWLNVRTPGGQESGQIGICSFFVFFYDYSRGTGNAETWEASPLGASCIFSFLNHLHQRKNDIHTEFLESLCLQCHKACFGIVLLFLSRVYAFLYLLCVTVLHSVRVCFNGILDAKRTETCFGDLFRYLPFWVFCAACTQEKIRKRGTQKRGLFSCTLFCHAFLIKPLILA